MSNLVDLNPYGVYNDLQGRPLNNGKVYIGLPNQDPKGYPAQVYWDAAMTIPAAQPLRTVGGYVARNGTPARVYVNGNYSLQVTTSTDVQVFYVQDYYLVGSAQVVTAGQLSASSGSSLIGWIQNYAGAALRFVQDKLREEVTFEDFGAVGDGVTNDAAAIQAAINSGRRIKVLEKTYAVASQLTGVSNLSMFGTGMFKGGLKAIAAIDSLIYFLDKSNVSISGLFFDGNNNTLSNLRFYSQNMPSNIYIDNNRFTGTKNDVNLFYGCIEVSEALGSSTARYKNINITNNYFHDCGTHGAVVAYSDKVTFIGNALLNIGQHGFEAVRCTNVIETNNNIDTCGTVGPGGSGLGVGSHTAQWVISDNIIKNCKGDAPITCEFTSIYGTISNNVIVDSWANAGINVSYGSNLTNDPPFNIIRNISVVNNKILNKQGVTTSTTATGINVYSTSTQGIGISVFGNTIDGFNVGIAGQYLSHSNFNDNIVINMTGTNSIFMLMAWVTKTSISRNKCNSITGDHAIKLNNYSTNYCDGLTVEDNVILSSGSGANKALVYVEGTGTHNISGNQTGGSLNYVTTTDASSIIMTNNIGALVAAPFAGNGSLLASSGNATPFNDFAIIGGIRMFPGTAIPTTGTYRYNDRIVNTNCTVGQPKGWICTAGGTPGTWVSEGNL